MTKIIKEDSTHKKWSYWQFFGIFVALYIGSTLLGDYKPLLRFDVWYAAWLYEIMILLGVAFIFWLPFKIFSDIRAIFRTSKSKRMRDIKGLVVKYAKGLFAILLLLFSVPIMLFVLANIQQSPISSFGIIVGIVGILIYICYLLYKYKYEWFKKNLENSYMGCRLWKT